MEKEIRIHGRMITRAGLELIRHLLQTEGHLGRTHLSQRLCRLWVSGKPMAPIVKSLVAIYCVSLSNVASSFCRHF
jgi:hypothetical protein